MKLVYKVSLFKIKFLSILQDITGSGTEPTAAAAVKNVIIIIIIDNNY